MNYLFWWGLDQQARESCCENKKKRTGQELQGIEENGLTILWTPDSRKRSSPACIGIGRWVRRKKRNIGTSKRKNHHLLAIFDLFHSTFSDE